MTQPSLFRRASKRCLNGLKRTLSREKTTQDDRSSVSKRSIRSSFSTSSWFTSRTLEEEKHTCLDDPIPEVPETEPCSPHHQGQSPFFRKLPPEIREQIYKEFWRAAGVERHVFWHKEKVEEEIDEESEEEIEEIEEQFEVKIRYSPCITDHRAPDERQIGLARDFAPSPDEQYHPEWFERMQSTWCNHWRCQRLWEDIREKKAVDPNENQAFMGLLLSCKQIYNESIESFRESKTITITDAVTLMHILKAPRPKHITGARYINISLRGDSGNYLYLTGSNIWYTFTQPEFQDLRRVYLWLDAECPVTRRLLPEFRDLWRGSTLDVISPKLTVDFPCDAEDGFWAWGEVEEELRWGESGSGTKTAEKFEPKFAVVARGRPKFNLTDQPGLVTSKDLGRPRVRVLGASNPFEDILLYGRVMCEDANRKCRC